MCWRSNTSFVAVLNQRQLVDEFLLFANPTVIGRVTAPFHSPTSIQSLILVDACNIDSEIAVMYYTHPRL
jgi:hypothetical protein